MIKGKQIETTPVKTLEDEVVVKIASGADHLVALTSRGEIFTVGNAEQGQLGRVAECFSYRGGRKGLELLLEPERVACRRRKAKFEDVWTGTYVTYAKEKDSGSIYAWGLNNYYQLGWLFFKISHVYYITVCGSRIGAKKYYCLQVSRT